MSDKKRNKRIIISDEKRDKRIVVVCGSPGIGKSVVVHGVLKLMPSLCRVITATSRQPRPGEQDGIDYHFRSKEELLDMDTRGELFEFNKNYETGQFYAVPNFAIEDAARQGTPVANLNLVGAIAVRHKFPRAFIVSLGARTDEEIHERLIKRKMSASEMLHRILEMENEIKLWRQSGDLCVINPNGRPQACINAVCHFIEGYLLGQLELWP